MADTREKVKDVVSTGCPQLGHNGGPDLYVRDVGKLQAIDAVLKNPKLNSTQALILIGLIVRSNDQYANAFPGGATLAIYAKVKRTDAVFKALRELEDQFKLIHRENRGQGKSNSYTVLPQRVVDAVVAAYEERKAAKAAATTEETHPSKAGELPQETNTPKAGEFSEPTRLKRAPAQTGHPLEAGATHPPKAGTIHSISNQKKKDLSAHGRDFWKSALNPESDVLFEDGKLTLMNGLRVHWLEAFDNDEKRLDLALTQAAAFIQPFSVQPLERQVAGQLARIAGEKHDKDKRYAAASTRQQAQPRGETARERKIRETAEFRAKHLKPREASQ